MIAPQPAGGPKARPILFSAPMIRALLDGRKTQTRRKVNPQSWFDGLDAIIRRFPHQSGCPYGKPGDLLWVREGHALDGSRVFHREGHDEASGRGPRVDARWRSSIHMPRWASRLTLELTDVRVQRLQEITLQDARAEGCEVREFSSFGADSAGRQEIGAMHYRFLWESINGEGSWDANPFVWALSFRVHRQNVDALIGQRRAA